MTRSKLWLAAFFSLLMLGMAAPAYADDSTTLRPLDNLEVVMIIVGLAALVIIGYVYAARGSANSRDDEE